MPYATCPECDGRVRFVVSPDIGDIVQCETCGSRLEVVALDPIELDWPGEIEADENISVEDAELILHPLPLVDDLEEEEDEELDPVVLDDDEQVDDPDAGLSDDDAEYSGGRGRHVH